MRPRALDLFCGAGGASMGLYRAGFDVVGVDHKPQKRYPAFHDADYAKYFRFVQADALRPPVDLTGFDFIWASPPCQSYSAAMRHLATPQPMLIDPVREMLDASGAVWVIENVVGAPLRTSFILCGTMFSLRIHRHRLFESPHVFALVQPCAPRKPILNPHRAQSRERIYREFGRRDPEKIWRDEMGVSWMSRHETRESIPPVYSEFIGKQVRQILERAA